ncbi:MAG: ABC transporter ATP-binding protein [Deltaproteobacteria bacterium]|nr:ABC transporter ATP-binding protein [Deltaproteobacteria bacterium]
MSGNRLLKVKINSVRTPDGYFILKDIEFELFEKETLCIIGESGSGKSMTGYCIMGLLPPNLISDYEICFSKGEVTLCRPENFRGRDITMIFQEPMTALNPLFTIGAQLAESIKGYNNQEKEKIVTDALKSVGIRDAHRVYHSYPHQLSGGMRQRALIAMAFLPNPSVVIADEPTTSLDVTVASGILSLVNQLKKTKGTSLIFISHDLNIVEKMADRILVMYGGTVMEGGALNDILKKPLHPYTKAIKRLYEERRRGDRKHLPEIRGFVPSIREMPAGCPFNPRCELSTEQCLKEMPPVSTLTNGHIIRCFNYKSAL